MQKKILITRFPYESVFSGEEIHTLLLAEKLRQKNFEIIFAGSCPVLLPEFAKRDFQSAKFWGGKALVSAKAFWFFAFTFPFVLLSFAQLAYFAKFKWKVNCVYMLSLNEKLFLTPWLKIFKIKTIWVEHSRIGDWLAKNPFLFLYKFFSKSVQIISVSKQTQKQLVELGVPEKQIRFILNGVDVQDLENVEERELIKWQNRKIPQLTSVLRSPDCGTKDELSRGLKKIGLITRLYADKGVDYFLGALRELIKKYPNLQVFIVGEGPQAKELRFFAQDLPVQFLGKIEHNEIKYFLHSMDFLILPSTEFDPFGLAPAEAMICKKPVIVTEVCGISDFMRDEENGLIIPARDTQAIISAFEKFFQNPEFAQKIAEAGFQLAKEKFGLERMASEYEEFVSC